MNIVRICDYIHDKIKNTCKEKYDNENYRNVEQKIKNDTELKDLFGKFV